ncbi:MAG: glycosyltransferase [Paramuribaculum sp.]|nr:glycosyltransferase [Paramuribaculum sp.]
MREEMKRSFLSDYPFRVIHNGIDLDVFRPIVRGTKCFTRGTDCFTRGTQCSTDFVTYLGVASIWLDEKGLPDLIRMSGMLNSDERMVLVGKLPKGMKQGLPKNVTHVPRTENVTELARMYSEASVFLNPTWQDNYPTVNLEAQACGTPVVTYRTGGSPESLTPATGAVVEQGDVDGMLAQARRFAAMDRDVVRGACREHALRNFAKTDRYNDYIELYQSML